MVGNIGNPYTSAAWETTEESVVVAEISSFQLEDDTYIPPEGERYPEYHAGPPEQASHDAGIY